MTIVSVAEIGTEIKRKLLNVIMLLIIPRNFRASFLPAVTRNPSRGTAQENCPDSIIVCVVEIGTEITRSFFRVIMPPTFHVISV
jgi:hypothetical protein